MAVAILLFYFLAGAAEAVAAVYPDVPSSVDPQKRYVLYLHGAWLETHRLNEAHPHHGPYEYHNIIRTLAAKEYEVISELRASEVPTGAYADKVAEQVFLLMEQGVPPEHITVLGHSKGGLMTLIAAGRVQKPKLNYVVMAGCGRREAMFRRGYGIFLDREARNLKGRILSIYDADDREAGSCQEAFDQAADAETKEITLHTGRGHGLFYSAEPAWIEKVVEWMSER